MPYDAMLSKINEEGISDDERAKRMKELHAFVKSQNHLYDDHGSAVIGSRDRSPKFQE